MHSPLRLAEVTLTCTQMLGFLTHSQRPVDLARCPTTKPASSSLPLTIFYHHLFLFGLFRSYFQGYVVGSWTISYVDMWMRGSGTQAGTHLDDAQTYGQ